MLKAFSLKLGKRSGCPPLSHLFITALVLASKITQNCYYSQMI